MYVFAWNVYIVIDVYMCVCICICVCLTLCGPMDCSLPGSSVRGILQAGRLQWVAMSALAGGFFTTSATWEDPVCSYHNLKNWENR